MWRGTVAGLADPRCHAVQWGATELERGGNALARCLVLVTESVRPAQGLHGTRRVAGRGSRGLAVTFRVMASPRCARQPAA